MIRPVIWHKDDWIIQSLGCASHSSAKSERDYQDDDCIWMTPEEEEKRIRQHEREKVLSELETWGCGYYGYVVNSTSLMEKITELRKQEQR